MTAPEIQLDDLTPENAAGVPLEQVPALVAELGSRQVHLSAVLSVLLARLARGSQDQQGGRLLGMEEVADRLGVPVAYARELGRRGEIPTVHVGKYVRVREMSLQRWMRQREEALGAVPARAYSPSRRGRRQSSRPLAVEAR